ncbi:MULTISPECIES: hypothetical protein [unclassified Variovorax]|uniref:hypothetical protein n=1 Tax=unclassified Variovorax TaxID=663243 RepID=UPI0008CA0341|nr:MULTISPECIES: hypothetical protein [unclassified Variovorax]SEK01224.1 hypothetical protein SAMN05518853_10647 [Variovorax sp. OK202]SFD30980.1 hypothetical protein SAMN05444746_10647 [Variovorax sp. OK212]
MNLNPQWNTPPNGDFARYVERLSAQAALPKRAAREGEPGLDVGMTPSPGQQGPVTAAMQRAEQPGIPGMLGSPNGEVPRREPGSFDPALLKVLGVVGALVFLVLWAAGVPFGVLVLLAGVTLWLGRKLKGVKLTPGVAKWQQVLEEAARKQREQQHKQGSK